MENLKLLYISFSFCIGIEYSAQSHCMRGFYLNKLTSKIDVCVPCEDGLTFMPLDEHTKRECYDCTQITDYIVEVLITPCNRTHDSHILCQPGYYRKRGRKHHREKCVPCTVCPNPTRPCQGYHDTVCCGHSDNEAVLNHHDVYVCKPRYIRCTRGQYFDQHTGDCSACPRHSYMPAQDHTFTQCLPCRTLPKGNTTKASIIQPCRDTSPTLFGCPEGYFRDLGQDLTLALTCSPCRECQTVSRPCDMFHDAVCCPETDLNISGETDMGSTCLPDKKVTCGQGQYVYINQSDGSRVCHGCPAGTFMEQENHTRTACKSCSDLLADFGTCCTSENMKTKSENIVNMFYCLAIGYILYKLFTTFIFFNDYWSYLTGRNARSVNKIKLFLYSFLHTSLFVLRMGLILSFSGVISIFDEPYLFFALVLFVIFTSGCDNWIMKRNKALFVIANGQ